MLAKTFSRGRARLADPNDGDFFVPPVQVSSASGRRADRESSDLQGVRSGLIRSWARELGAIVCGDLGMCICLCVPTLPRRVLCGLVEITGSGPSVKPARGVQILWYDEVILISPLAVFPSLKEYGRTHIGSRPAGRISTDTTRASPVVAGFAVSEVRGQASDLLIPPVARSFPDADSVFFFVGDERGHPSRTLASKVLVPRFDQTRRDALPTKVGEHGQAVHVAPPAVPTRDQPPGLLSARRASTGTP